MWGIGYSLTWVAKWTLATGITGINYFSDAAGEAQYRMLGNETWVLNRRAAIGANLLKFLTPENIVISLILTVVLIILVLLSRQSVKGLLRPAPIFLVALYPYIRFFVLGNHSQFHSFFTYRSQIFTAFIGLAYLSHFVDFNRIKETFAKLFKKNKKEILPVQDGEEK